MTGSPHTCDQCGGSLGPKSEVRFGGSLRRADKRYCSPACRQKAYRARARGLASAPSAIRNVDAGAERIAPPASRYDSTRRTRNARAPERDPLGAGVDVTDRRGRKRPLSERERVRVYIESPGALSDADAAHVYLQSGHGRKACGGVAGGCPVCIREARR